MISNSFMMTSSNGILHMMTSAWTNLKLLANEILRNVRRFKANFGEIVHIFTLPGLCSHKNIFWQGKIVVYRPETLFQFATQTVQTIPDEYRSEIFFNFQLKQYKPPRMKSMAHFVHLNCLSQSQGTLYMWRVQLLAKILHDEYAKKYVLCPR